MKKFLLSLIIFYGISGLVFGEELTSERSVKEFFKNSSELRVGKEAIEYYRNTLNRLSLKVIKKATELAKAKKRKTVLERDIKKASDEVFGKAPMTTTELMEKIKLLSIIDLAELTKQVKSYGQELLEQRAE